MPGILLPHRSSNPLEAPSHMNSYSEDDNRGSDPLNIKTTPRKGIKLTPVKSQSRFAMINDSDTDGDNDALGYEDADAVFGRPEPIPIVDEDQEGVEWVELDSDMGEQDAPRNELLDQDQEMDSDSPEEKEQPRFSDESLTIYRKPPEERRDIEAEIEDLERQMPGLAADYRLFDRLGTGTFSSVYKAIDLHYHSKWWNNPWRAKQPSGSSAQYQSATLPEHERVFVAVKRIYVTSSPQRILNEISILRDIRGCRHACQLITAFRHADQVVAVMPFQQSADFRTYFRSIPLSGIQAYFRCMFRALRDIHARGIIHRDVKPANFLFDHRTNIGVLCDFGLASRTSTTPSYSNSCLHTPATKEHPYGQHRPRAEMDVDWLKDKQREARLKGSSRTENIGYPDHDQRPQSKANRAGTRGFRAPEVLFKCPDQTGAIDVWSAGIILLFFLTGKFPLFQSNDDVEALVEIALIVGQRNIERTATLHSRTFSTNLPHMTAEGITWSQFVLQQNPSLMNPPGDVDNMKPEDVSEHEATVHKALDLLDRTLKPDSCRRIQPRDALSHPFLRPDDPKEEDDDAFFPHPFAEGICGKFHGTDEVTEQRQVQAEISIDDKMFHAFRPIAHGEGVAIGNHPCEFHPSTIE